MSSEFAGVEKGLKRWLSRFTTVDFADVRSPIKLMISKWVLSLLELLIMRQSSSVIKSASSPVGKFLYFLSSPLVFNALFNYLQSLLSCKEPYNTATFRHNLTSKKMNSLGNKLSADTEWGEKVLRIREKFKLFSKPKEEDVRTATNFEWFMFCFTLQKNVCSTIPSSGWTRILTTATCWEFQSNCCAFIAERLWITSPAITQAVIFQPGSILVSH